MTSNLGRPRVEGDRYPGGKLKPAGALTKTQNPSVPQLTSWQAAAARRYAKAYERVSTATGAKALEAKDDLRLARADLAPMEIAILDMMVGRGVDLVTLSGRTGRRTNDLEGMLSKALTRLARHYEARVEEG